MKEKRRGLARVGEVAERLGANARRRQQRQGPRVVLYESDGRSRLFQPGASGYDQLVDAAEALLGRSAPPVGDEPE